MNSLPVWERVRVAFHNVEDARKARIQRAYDSKARETLATRQKTVDAQSVKVGKQRVVWDRDTRAWRFA